MTDRLLRAVRLALSRLDFLARTCESDTSLAPQRFGNRLPQGLEPHSVRAMRDEVLDVAGRCQHDREDSPDVRWCPWPDCAEGISLDVVAASHPLGPDEELGSSSLGGGFSLRVTRPGPMAHVRFRRRQVGERWAWVQERG